MAMEVEDIVTVYSDSGPESQNDRKGFMLCINIPASGILSFLKLCNLAQIKLYFVLSLLPGDQPYVSSDNDEYSSSDDDDDDDSYSSSDDDVKWTEVYIYLFAKKGVVLLWIS